jgi:hypothetical protein
MTVSGDIDLAEVSEIVGGVRDFFDVSVGRQLLYSIEKPQFQAVIKQVSTLAGI